MQTLRFQALGSEKEVNSALNVVIAYEDLETGKRAIKTYEYMVEQLGNECLFSNQMWKFDVLAVPRLKEIAAKDAAAADIIIVSAHEGNHLPIEVKAWMESWLSYKSQASALVGLFGNESVNSPVRNYLAEVARSAPKLNFSANPEFGRSISLEFCERTDGIATVNRCRFPATECESDFVFPLGNQ